MSYTLDEINKGQAKINFQLVEVDQKTISVIRAMLSIFKDMANVPGAPAHLKKIDFGSLEKALDGAEEQSKGVASITPPGCQAPPY